MCRRPKKAPWYNARHIFVSIRLLDARSDAPSQRIITCAIASVASRDVKTTQRHLPHECKESNQRTENSFRTMNTTRWHKERKENPRSTSTPCLTSKLSKETGQLIKLTGARRSRSFSFILSPQPSPFLSQPINGERRAFLAVTQRLLWQRQPNNHASSISWHSMSRAMWQLNATSASSQSCKKREILSPSPHNPMTCSASLHTLLPREPLEDTLLSSDQASPHFPTLDYVHSSPKSGA